MSDQQIKALLVDIDDTAKKRAELEQRDFIIAERVLNLCDMIGDEAELERTAGCLPPGPVRAFLVAIWRRDRKQAESTK